MIKDGKVVKLS